MTTEEIRKHAEAIILDHAKDVEFLSIAEHLENHDVDDPGDALAEAIDDEIRAAKVTVTWEDAP